MTMQNLSRTTVSALYATHRETTPKTKAECKPGRPTRLSEDGQPCPLRASPLAYYFDDSTPARLPNNMPIYPPPTGPDTQAYVRCVLSTFGLFFGLNKKPKYVPETVCQVVSGHLFVVCCCCC